MELSRVPNHVHVLIIICSDPANLLLMTQLIGTRGDLRALTAYDGSEGIQLAEMTRPEVVIMDTEMSDMCVFQALKTLRTNHSTSHVPVIAVSSDAQPAHIDSGLQAGFYRYLTKPYRLGDLLDAIGCALRYSHCESEGFDAYVNVQCAESKVAQVPAGH